MPSKSGADEPAHDRAAPRRAITMDASLRGNTARAFKVQVLDLSTKGFKVETFSDLKVGSDFFLRLPGLEPRQATVMWVEGYYAGCAFTAPLHQAVVDTIARKAG